MGNSSTRLVGAARRLYEKGMSDGPDALALRQVLDARRPDTTPETMAAFERLMSSSEVEVAARASYEVASYRFGMGSHAEAMALVEQAEAMLDGVEAPLVRALLLVLRISNQEEDVSVDNLPSLREAGERLASERFFESAGDAYGIVARKAGDLDDRALMRAAVASAIGSLEMGGAKWMGQAELVGLSRRELSWGELDAAKAHIEHVISRLSGVLLLSNARFIEAQCFELLGDVHLASGDVEEARRAYELSAEKQVRLERRRAAEHIREKIDALSNETPHPKAPEPTRADTEPAIGRALRSLREAALAKEVSPSALDSLRATGELLTSHRMYADATEAHALAAHAAAHADDRAVARIAYAAAIGNAELACDKLRGLTLLISRARFELTWGDSGTALHVLSHVELRLRTLKTREARSVEAECFELAGDACVAHGDLENARQTYALAADAHIALGASAAAAAIREKTAQL